MEGSAVRQYCPGPFVLFIKAGSMVYNAFALCIFKAFLCAYAFRRPPHGIYPGPDFLPAQALLDGALRLRTAFCNPLREKNPGTVQSSTLFICILGVLMAAVLVLGCRKKS